MNHPFFSVIIPTYNRATQLSSAIQSVLNQSFHNYELVIVDDGSVDETKKVVAQFNDHRISYVYRVNGGVSSARNAGAVIAKSNWLLFLDSDDTVEKTWLSDFKFIIESSTHLPQLVFCQVKLIVRSYPNNFIKLIDPRKPYSNSNQAGIFLTGAFAIKKELFLKVGQYDERLRHSENTELGFRIMPLKPSFDFVDFPNLVYSQSESGGSKNLQNKFESTVYILQKHQAMFSQQKHVKQLYLQVAGVSAIKIGKYKEGRKLITQALLTRPFVVKAWLQWLAAQLEFTARITWRM